MKGLSNLKPQVQRLDQTMAQPLPQEQTWGQGRGGRPWRRIRARILERDHYLCQCEDCKANHLVTLADEVDHIIPTSQGGTDEDWNLRAINAEHHKLKTARESQGGRRG